MAFAAAVVADAGDDEAVAGDAEVVFAGDGVAERLQFFAAELDELVADLAVKVVVLRVAVVVFVDGPATERHFAEEARFDQFVERAVNGWAADFVAVVATGEAVDQLVRVEVVVTFEDVVDECPALLRDPLAAALQVFLESLLGGGGDVDFAE